VFSLLAAQNQSGLTIDPMHPLMVYHFALTLQQHKQASMKVFVEHIRQKFAFTAGSGFELPLHASPAGRRSARVSGYVGTGEATLRLSLRTPSVFFYDRLQRFFVQTQIGNRLAQLRSSSAGASWASSGTKNTCGWRKPGLRLCRRRWSNEKPEPPYDGIHSLTVATVRLSTCHRELLSATEGGSGVLGAA